MAEGGYECVSAPNKVKGLPYGIPTERDQLRQPIVCMANLNTEMPYMSEGGHSLFMPVSGMRPEETEIKSYCNIPPQPRPTTTTPLNIEAKEFKVPEHKRFTLSATAEEFIPQASFTNTTTVTPSLESQVSDITYQDETDEYSEISEFEAQVQELLYTLTINPASFDSVVLALVEMLDDAMVQDDLLKLAVDIIFERAITDFNLRYNAARICNALVHNLQNDGKGTRFRNGLISRCQEEFKNKDRSIQDKGLAERLRGFVYFLGELYIHLEVLIPHCQPSKFDALGTNLHVLFQLLLINPINDNLKCVTQVLKFTGPALEDSNPNDMASLIEKIKEVSLNPNIGRNMNECLVKIVELRASNWGRATTPVTEEPFVYNGFNNDPVFYGPDGQPITSEETQFLEAASNQYLQGFDAADDAYGESYAEYTGSAEWATAEEDKLDDEIAAAYEDFLAEQQPSYTR